MGIAVAILQVVGATKDFLHNNQAMRRANTIGADKYFHCKANCEATQRGAVGEIVAEVMSEVRELYGDLKGDPDVDEQADQEANQDGRDGVKSNPEEECNLVCARHRPNGLDEEY